MFHQRRHTKCFAELQTVIQGGFKTALEVCSLLDNPEEVFSKWRSCAFADGSYGEFEIDTGIYVNDLLRIGERKHSHSMFSHSKFSESKCSKGDKSPKLSGFIFGVDYYGNPIVADMLGRIRIIEFPKSVCEKCGPSDKFESFADFCTHFDEKCNINKLAGMYKERDLRRWIFPWIKATSSADWSIGFRRYEKERFSEAGYIHIGTRHDLDVEYLFKLPTANLSVGSVRQDASKYRRYEHPIGPHNYYEMV